MKHHDNDMTGPTPKPPAERKKRSELALSLCLCMAFSLALFSQAQGPPVWGEYDFQLDGDASFDIDANTHVENHEHGRYYLHYKSIIDIYGHPANMVSTTPAGKTSTEDWIRQTITTKTGLSGPHKTTITTLTQKLVGNGVVNDQPSTLYMVDKQVNGRAVRTLQMASGDSFPAQVFVEQTQKVTDESGNILKDSNNQPMYYVTQFNLTLHLTIRDSEWAKLPPWTTPNGQIDTFNDYKSYQRPDHTSWERVQARWTLNNKGQ